MGFTKFKFGYGSAIAWLLFLIIMVAALVNVSIVRRLGRSAGGVDS
jgi:cellobiose transport system permease protein